MDCVILPCLFNLSNSVTRGCCLKLVKPSCSSDIRKYFFTSRVIDVWNCLNDDIVKSRSISVFKKRLSGVKFDRFLTVGLTDWLCVFFVCFKHVSGQMALCFLLNVCMYVSSSRPQIMPTHILRHHYNCNKLIWMITKRK